MIRSTNERCARARARAAAVCDSFARAFTVLGVGDEQNYMGEATDTAVPALVKSTIQKALKKATTEAEEDEETVNKQLNSM